MATTLPLTCAVITRNDKGPDLSQPNTQTQVRCLQLMIEYAMDEARLMNWQFLANLLGMALTELHNPTDFREHANDLKTERRMQSSER